MLTMDDIKNLITLVNRASYANLAEAKYGVQLEARLHNVLKVQQEAVNKASGAEEAASAE